MIRLRLLMDVGEGPYFSRTKFPLVKYPVEVKAFKGIHDRVMKGWTTSRWAYTTEGFYRFLDCVGEVPKDMKRPTIGRVNHNKGYEPENCDWQEFSENSLEGLGRAWRMNTGKRCKRSTRIKISLAQKGRKFSALHKKRLSIGQFNRNWDDDESRRRKISRSLRKAWAEGRR